jgi:hypothetical protein
VVEARASKPESLDSYFARTKNLQSRRLKREMSAGRVSPAKLWGPRKTGLESSRPGKRLGSFLT